MIRLFTVSVRVGHYGPGSGIGRSKREAEQAAATARIASRRRLAGGRDAVMSEPESTPATTRSGFVALIGAPNAGKSTLVNQLVGAKVSIVTHKVQTTRAIVRGIATHDNAQIVFVDTPGIFRPRRRLDKAMVTTAWGGAKDADIVLVLIDAERGIKGDAEVATRTRCRMCASPKILILNKVDRVRPERLLALSAEANKRVEFARDLS